MVIEAMKLAEKFIKALEPCRNVLKMTGWITIEDFETERLAYKTSNQSRKEPKRKDSIPTVFHKLNQDKQIDCKCIEFKIV